MAYLKPQSPLQYKDGDYFYPLTTADQVILEDGNRLNTVFKHTVKTNATLLASGWSESSPYIQAVTINESIDDYNVDIDIIYSGTKETDLILNAAASCITYVKKNGNEITFYCLNNKPETDISVEITGTCRNTIANVVVVEEDGVKLNFEIIGGTVEPFDTIENTIWVNTDTEITGYQFSATEPKEAFDGKVWIYIGSSSHASFDIVDNVSIYPIYAKQYISGKWVDKAAKIYQGNGWVDWWNGYLYELGNEWTDITGGWIAEAVPIVSSVEGKELDITRNLSDMVISCSSGYSGIVRTKNSITFDTDGTLYLDATVSSDLSSEHDHWCDLYVWSGIGTEYIENIVAYICLEGKDESGTFAVPVPKGQYYIGFGMYHDYSTITMRNLYIK